MVEDPPITYKLELQPRGVKKSQKAFRLTPADILQMQAL